MRTKSHPNMIYLKETVSVWMQKYDMSKEKNRESVREWIEFFDPIDRAFADGLRAMVADKNSVS